MNDLHTDPQHFRIGGKEAVQEVAADVQQDADHDGGCKAHGQTGADTLTNPLHLARAVVLPCEGGDSDTKGTDGHPEESVHFAVYGPGCHGVRSQAVDGSLNDDIGKAVHDGLQAGRKADLDNAVQHYTVNADFVQIESVHILYSD